VGKKVVFLIRIATLPRMRICEMMVPDYRIVMYEPLFQALLGFLNQPLPNQVANEKISCAEDTHNHQLGHLERFGRHQFVAKQSANEHSTNSRHISHDSVHHRAFHHRAAHVRQAKQLLRRAQKEHHRFELLVGYKGDPWEWHADIIVGTVQCMLLSKYSPLMAVVEEARLWPFESRASRGDLGDVTPEGPQTPKLPHTPRSVSSESNAEDKGQSPGARPMASRRVQVQGGCLNTRSTSTASAISVSTNFFTPYPPLKDSFSVHRLQERPSMLAVSPTPAECRPCFCSPRLRGEASEEKPKMVPDERALVTTPRAISPGSCTLKEQRLVAAAMPMWEVLIHTVPLDDLKQGWVDKRSARWREAVRRQKRKTRGSFTKMYT